MRRSPLAQQTRPTGQVQNGKVSRQVGQSTGFGFAPNWLQSAQKAQRQCPSKHQWTQPEPSPQVVQIVGVAAVTV
jgi:hypothetical protein